jgi:hypothetical protein
MGAYWSRVPGTQAMPSIWVYELEKRVRSGSLSREDAIGIFNTALESASLRRYLYEPTALSIIGPCAKAAGQFLQR